MLIPAHRLKVTAAVFATATALALWLATPWVQYRLGLVALSVLGMFLVDVAISPFAGKARWYILHCAANMVVAATAFPDVVTTVLRPTHCFTGPFSLVPALVVPSIHLYHLIAFECSVGDWVHHVVFAGIICPLGLFFDPGPIQNMVGFFICGLPGGLDYGMLALVKLGLMNSFAEKAWNARINVWMRSPGLLLAACCCFLGRFNEHTPPEAKERVPWFVAVVSAVLCVLNGQYYMQVVVGNTFVRTRESGSKAYNS